MLEMQIYVSCLLPRKTPMLSDMVKKTTTLQEISWQDCRRLGRQDLDKLKKWSRKVAEIFFYNKPRNEIKYHICDNTSQKFWQN